MADCKQLIEIGRRAVELSSADETEVVLTGGGTNLTRFANNTIHQNVTRADLTLRVRAIVGKRVGVATTNDSSDDAMKRCVDAATEIARASEENPDLLPLPGPAQYAEVETETGESATFSPEQRAEAVGQIIAVAEENSLVASGAFATGPNEFAVANSNGVAADAVEAGADLNITMTGETSTGRATATVMNVAEIDAAESARVAARKAVDSADPVDVEPGEYTVILEEDAVGDMVSFLGYMGLGGKSFVEQRSFMCGRIGERVCGENVTILDDGHDSRLYPMPFDFEGVPRQTVTVIDSGIAKAVVHDRATAAEAGVEGTGHAIPPPATWGPFPMHLKLACGDATVDEMVASTERGLYVTRFHYTNIAHPLRTEITGMTRDGTFLIENGEITKGVKNLRFTQSILAAFSEINMIGATPRIAEGVLVPALKVNKFRFSGATEF